MLVACVRGLAESVRVIEIPADCERFTDTMSNQK